VKSQLTIMLLVLLVASTLMWAQEPAAPTPAPASGSEVVRDEVAGGGVLMFRGGGNWDTNPTKWKLGGGGEISIAHYFSKHFGLTAGGDLLYTKYLNFWEYGYRAGPIVRFRASRRMEPFLRGMGGYSRYKQTGTGPGMPYISGGSYIVGGGVDWWLTGGLSLRTALDFEGNPSFGTGRTRLFRFTAGFKYAFASEAAPPASF